MKQIKSKIKAFENVKDIMKVLLVRPCVRQNFPNFLFLRVSEMFGCQSLEIFWEKTEFSNSRNFRKKVQKKFGKKFGYYSKMYVNFKFFEKLCKVWVFESKNLVFGSKSSEEVWKKFGKFGNRVFRMFGHFRNCSIPKFPKITKKWH